MYLQQDFLLLWTFVQEDLDSEGEERAKKKPSKFKDDLKLKKKFNALLRKMKLNDADEPMIDDEVGVKTPGKAFSFSFGLMLVNDYTHAIMKKNKIHQDGCQDLRPGQSTLY